MRLLPSITLFLLAVGAGCSPRSARPPVVVIVLDALHAGHVTHLGYSRATTPNLDRLAAEGITFTQAIAPAPYTLATMTSLHTGLLPDAHGITQGGRCLAAARRTLAMHLTEHGWRSFGASGNLNAASLQGLERGFERFLEMHRPEGTRDRVGTGGGEAESEGDLRSMGLQPPLAEEFVPVLDEWIGALRDEDDPFLYLHLLEPHSPYRAPAAFRDRFVEPEYDGPFADGTSRPFLQSLRGEVDVTPRDIEAAIGLYDANLAYADAVVGRLFERLRAAGLYDDAVILVTSDHGEAFWQHGVWGHNSALWEEMVRVPLVVRLPDRADLAGRRIDPLVSPMDVLPSLCEWLGLPTPEGLNGVSLERAIEGAPEALRRKLVLRTHDLDPTLALRADGVKLVVGEEGSALFDLVADPMERRPLPPDAHPAGAAMSAFLERYESIRGEWEGSAVEGVTLTAEQRRLLEELGYLR